MTETLTLKWGTVKGWQNLSGETVQILQRWADLGANMSAAMQHDTDEQKQLICDAIDSVTAAGGVICNDWSGEDMTAKEAKQYVREYGKRAALGEGK